MARPRSTKEYAYYKGDDLVAMGTAYELAKQLGISRRTITYYNTPTYKKRTDHNKNRIALVDIEKPLD